MKVAAVYAIANIVSADELKETYVIPDAFDPRVGLHVAKAVADAAVESKIARI
jgi:malate dehydrogenase (oxaloacetate-decarboxylating)